MMWSMRRWVPCMWAPLMRVPVGRRVPWRGEPLGGGVGGFAGSHAGWCTGLWRGGLWAGGEQRCHPHSCPSSRGWWPQSRQAGPSSLVTLIDCLTSWSLRQGSQGHGGRGLVQATPPPAALALTCPRCAVAVSLLLLHVPFMHAAVGAAASRDTGCAGMPLTGAGAVLGASAPHPNCCHRLAQPPGLAAEQR